MVWNLSNQPHQKMATDTTYVLGSFAMGNKVIVHNIMLMLTDWPKKYSTCRRSSTRGKDVDAKWSPEVVGGATKISQYISVNPT